MFREAYESTTKFVAICFEVSGMSVCWKFKMWYINEATPFEILKIIVIAKEKENE